jgi:hypothetical protein
MSVEDLLAKCQKSGKPSLTRLAENVTAFSVNFLAKFILEAALVDRISWKMLGSELKKKIDANTETTLATKNRKKEVVMAATIDAVCKMLTVQSNIVKKKTKRASLAYIAF